MNIVITGGTVALCILISAGFFVSDQAVLGSLFLGVGLFLAVLSSIYR